MAGHFQVDGSTDNLFSITRSTTNGYYYVPSLSELENINKLHEKKIKKDSNENTELEKKEVVNDGKPIVITFEYCTNCGYKTIFLQKKKVLQSFGAPGQVQIIENPQIPRLAAFEIAMQDGTVLFSKRALSDGMNNFPWCWPSDEELVLKLQKYFNLVDVKKEDILKAEKARHVVWGREFWPEEEFCTMPERRTKNKSNSNNNNNN